MPNKSVIICDTHFGVRNGSTSLHQNITKFYDDIFFKTIDRYNIDHIIHLGDLVDRRTYIDFITKDFLDRVFINPIINRNIRLDCIAGNHDCPFKNSNNLSAPRVLYEGKPGLNFYEYPVEVYPTHYPPVLYIPWICKDNERETYKLIERTSCDMVFGHLELSGFEMYKGSISEKGIDSNIFEKFSKVFSGHFHHKSTNKNIHYLGAPYEMVWSDYNDERGFHIFDWNTRKLEFIRNPYTFFIKVSYDDVKQNFNDILSQDFSRFNNKYVKVIVKQKTNLSLFDNFIERIEKETPIDMQIVDDHLNLDLDINNDNINIEDVEDTIQTLNKYIDIIDISISRQQVKEAINSLYLEAQSMETA